MDSIEILREDNTTKILIDGKEVSGIQSISIVKNGSSPVSVNIQASVKRARVASS